MTALSSLLVALAAKAELFDAGAIALPTVIEVASRKTGLTQRELIEQAMQNEPLRAYLAETARRAGQELAQQ